MTVLASLFLASKNGHTEIVDALLRAGANVDADRIIMME